jgi:poly(beta-D-mannuronate) C5 epimerase
MVLNKRRFTLILCAFLILGIDRMGLAGSERSLDPIKPKGSNRADGYVVRTATEEELKQLALEPPLLPDIRSYTAETVYAKLKKRPKGRVVIRRMLDMAILNAFTRRQGRLAEWATRQVTKPVAIVIEHGYVTPGDLVKILSPEYIEQTAPGVFILRRPMVVGPGATLHIDATIKEFRLSEEHGAFLVNDGLLFITDTALTGWREHENQPAQFRSDGVFRPFILSYGPQIYILNSKITSMGYSALKSYGVSISHSDRAVQRQRNRPRPTGWLINSTFRDNWFGFYSWEADDIVILGNSFLENIIYGIDPHTHSHRLIIANNIAVGTKRRHGIIFSEGVSDSWIFGNRSHHNHVSGIVLDRSSGNNVVADNQTYDNDGDGIALYESSNNLLLKNRVIGNLRHGIRVRNSSDIRLFENLISANKQVGIFGYKKDLSVIGRDVKLEPYKQQFSIAVVGGQLIHNGRTIVLDQPSRAQLYRVDFLKPFNRRGLQLTGILGEYHHQLLDILIRRRAAAII